MSAFATRYNTATIEGLEVFYREAGDPNNPTLLLLHGFPVQLPHVPQPDHLPGRRVPPGGP